MFCELWIKHKMTSSVEDKLYEKFHIQKESYDTDGYHMIATIQIDNADELWDLQDIFNRSFQITRYKGLNVIIV